MEHSTLVFGLVEGCAGDLTLQPEGSIPLVVVRCYESSRVGRRGVHLAVLGDFGGRRGSHGAQLLWCVRWSIEPSEASVVTALTRQGRRWGLLLLIIE